MSKSSSAKVSKVPVYWSTILLGLIVAAVFLMAIFTYQVQENERALVITVGKISGERGPGLHLRWPLPIQEIVKYDIRQRCFDGTVGNLEETMTADEKNVIVGIYTIYSIKEPGIRGRIPQQPHENGKRRDRRQISFRPDDQHRPEEDETLPDGRGHV